jgi:hypothetical protein
VNTYSPDGTIEKAETYFKGSVYTTVAAAKADLANLLKQSVTYFDNDGIQTHTYSLNNDGTTIKEVTLYTSVDGELATSSIYKALATTVESAAVPNAADLGVLKQTSFYIDGDIDWSQEYKGNTKGSETVTSNVSNEAPNRNLASMATGATESRSGKVRTWAPRSSSRTHPVQ